MLHIKTMQNAQHKRGIQQTMQNAQHNCGIQQSMQTVTNASVSSSYALILAQGGS